jgi:sugar lactone lactonase YvrE
MATTPTDVSRTLVDGLAFPECLRWHEDRLCFSDMHAHRVLAVNLDGALEQICKVEGRPGGLGWLPDGRLLVVAMTERKLYRLDGGSLRLHADLSPYIRYFLNDMVVDARGNAYVGHIGFDYYDGEDFKPAELWLVTPDGNVRSVAAPLYSPNGAVVTPDGATLIVGESSAARLTAFDIAHDGSLTDRRVWADLAGGVPDGLGIDAEGAVWAAMYGGKSVWQIAPGAGVVRRIGFDRDTYACAVGGPHGQTLFVATAKGHDPVECRRLRTGRIEMLEL